MFFRRSTHPSETDLSAYVDDELDVAQARRLAAHFERCDQCRMAISALRENKALMAPLPRPPMTRSFTLSAAQAGVQESRPAASRPSVLRLAPALSLAVLAVLLLVDIASPAGHSSRSASTATHGGLVAKSSSESANSAAGTTLQAPDTAAQAPRAAANSDAGVAGSTSPNASSAVLPPAPAPSFGSQAAPSAPQPGQSQAGASVSPPQVQSFAAPAAPAPAPSTGSPPTALVPPVAIQPFSAPSGGATSGSAATPQAAIGSGSAPVSPVPPVLPQPFSPNPVAPVPSPAQTTSVTVAVTTTHSGIKLLRVLEVLAAATFVTSLLIVFWPRLMRKER